MHITELYSYDKSNASGQVKTMDRLSDRVSGFVPTDAECYAQRIDLDDYHSISIHRISTRIQDFQCHRIIGTTVGTGKDAVYHEDKVTFTDPKIYFFRNSSGEVYPGPISQNNQGFDELCKSKCIRNCKDGWYWSTNFHRGKVDRKMVEFTPTLRTFIVNQSTTGTTTMPNFLKAVGIESKYGDGDLKGIHSMQYAIGRDPPYTAAWYSDKMGQKEISRVVHDYISFEMVTYITLRAFNHKR